MFINTRFSSESNDNTCTEEVRCALSWSRPQDESGALVAWSEIEALSFVSSPFAYLNSHHPQPVEE